MSNEQRDQLNTDIVLNVDLAPTILGAVGIPVPASMQGRDLAPLYLDETPADWRTDFFYEHPTIRRVDFIPPSEALVRKDWKYMYWPKPGLEQSFDLVNDPIEEHDLASDARYASQLAEMRERFLSLKSQAE